ncbi:MAG: AraC family transcriptional regulator [Pseudomonadota bacterium]
MDALNQLLATFRLKTDVINNAQYCGDWAIDTSGTGKASFHIISHADAYIRSDDLHGTVYLEKGDCVLFPRDSHHLLSNVAECNLPSNRQSAVSYEEGLKDDGVGLICGYFHFEQNAASALLDVLPDALVIQRRNSDGNIATLMDLMISESLRTSAGTEAVVDRLAEALFVIILKEHVENSDRGTGLAAALRDQKIHKALVGMQAEPHAKWTVDKLATLAAMSRSSFASRFKALLGESPMEYLTRWRMQVAYNLLDEERLPVLEVADRCGYDSEAAFAKAFKRVIGVGPGAVRQSIA